MKAISVHVDEQDYAELKVIAARRGRPVAEIIRESLARTAKEARGGRSVFDLPPFDGGSVLAPWTREELVDEMLDRTQPTA